MMWSFEGPASEEQARIPPATELELQQAHLVLQIAANDKNLEITEICSCLFDDLAQMSLVRNIALDEFGAAWALIGPGRHCYAEAAAALACRIRVWHPDPLEDMPAVSEQCSRCGGDQSATCCAEMLERRAALVVEHPEDEVTL